MKAQLRLFALTCFVFLLVGMPAAEEVRISPSAAQLMLEPQKTLIANEPVQLAYSPYYEDDDDQAYERSQGKRITCESKGERYNYCRTNIRGRIRLERQLSDAPCRHYETWGADPDGGGIWVGDGCRAVFRVEPRRASYDKDARHRSKRTQITCESTRERYNYCQTNMRGEVRLERQLSDAPCREYYTWGADGDGSGIWVSDGCRAVFVVQSGWARQGR